MRTGFNEPIRFGQNRNPLDRGTPRIDQQKISDDQEHSIATGMFQTLQTANLDG